MERAKDSIFWQLILLKKDIVDPNRMENEINQLEQVNDEKKSIFEIQNFEIFCLNIGITGTIPKFIVDFPFL